MIETVKQAQVGKILSHILAFDFIWFNSLSEEPEGYISDVSLTCFYDIEGVSCVCEILLRYFIFSFTLLLKNIQQFERDIDLKGFF